jgi:hypothetical protein
MNAAPFAYCTQDRRANEGRLPGEPSYRPRGRDPQPQTTGRQVTAGQRITLTTDTPAPDNPSGPWTRRVTGERFEKALRMVINSVVFHSSGQHLTTAGTYTEMASRLAEPVFLGLAVLAVRSRVKR